MKWNCDSSTTFSVPTVEVRGKEAARRKQKTFSFLFPCWPVPWNLTSHREPTHSQLTLRRERISQRFGCKLKLSCRRGKWRNGKSFFLALINYSERAFCTFFMIRSFLRCCFNKILSLSASAAFFLCTLRDALRTKAKESLILSFVKHKSVFLLHFVMTLP